MLGMIVYTKLILYSIYAIETLCILYMSDTCVACFCIEFKD